MEQTLPDEDVIRRYLLGMLAEAESGEIEEKLFASEAYAETADVVEDDLIDQYLDGSLSQSEKQAVETHFLRPRSRREKLRVASLARHHFGQPSPLMVTPRNFVPQPVWYTRRWMLAGALSTFLLSSLSVYLLVGQLTLSKKLKDTKQQLAIAKLQGNQDSSIPLELRSGLTRGPGSRIPTVISRPANLVIQADLILPGPSSAQFRIQLEDQQGREIWSQAGLKPAANQSARLRFDIPLRGLNSGQYTLVVSVEGSQSTPLFYPVDINVE